MKKLIILLLITFLLLTACSKVDTSGVSVDKHDPQQEESLEEPQAEDAELEEVPEKDLESSPEEGSEEILEEESNIITLVVPEGYTVARIGMRLEELGVCTVGEFLQASIEGDYSDFSLISQQESNPNRCYNLEGYLFPDTYQIYRDDSPDTIIRKMLANSEKKFTPDIREQISKSGFTTDEIIALASIVQKEAYDRNSNAEEAEREMPKVSSVLHNRLKQDMMLQCNVTATYVNGVLAEFVENGFEIYNDYYNTYHCPALPVGAICNSGIDAIIAAINPADTDYLYFLTDENKNFYYSSDYDEHLKLVEKYLPEND